VADAVLAAGGFKGLYLDANAISPQRAVGIGEKLESAGIRFVDGGIIGGPAWEPGTVLYISGAEAHRIADCFRDSPLQVSLLGREIGRASALKMCYAAYSKGTSALLAAILALADASGVRDDLYGQWDRDGILDPGETEKRVRRVTAKAWRFAGEMDEIADTFEAAGLPGGFHRAAGEVYRRMEAFKGSAEMPALAGVISGLLHKTGG
jgi:3-hydroxyisobutyrate dehydrogenase-like beta-hydroxyacid dehydrogenase